MSKFKYHYNPETCQYERARLNLRDVIFYLFGLMITAAIFLAGMLTVHNHFVETEREHVLRSENAALRKHKSILGQELTAIESTLSRLREEDKSLYTKLFNSPPQESSSLKSTISKEQVLLANASGFQSLLDVLKSKSSSLISRSTTSNAVFGSDIQISKEDVKFIAAIPAIQPISNPQLDKLVSGFGTRINPFHKGMYDHPGVDFAAPRGAAVFATAPGKVTDIKRSALQAGYGNYIEIDHGNGYVTRYAHLEEITIKFGQRVAKGDVIGLVGNTGGSTAPHVHYEVIHNGEQVDPALYMLEGLTSGEHSQLLQLSKKQNQSLD